MKVIIKVVREIYRPKQIIGKMYLNDVFFCNTLEDIERTVKVYGETAIPLGTYKMIINMSTRFKELMPLLLNVPGFDGIRVHPGNTEVDTHGCILIGDTVTKDGIGQSKVAFNRLMEELKKYTEFEVQIVKK